MKEDPSALSSVVLSGHWQLTGQVSANYRLVTQFSAQLSLSLSIYLSISVSLTHTHTHTHTHTYTHTHPSALSSVVLSGHWQLTGQVSANYRLVTQFSAQLSLSLSIYLSLSLSLSLSIYLSVSLSHTHTHTHTHRDSTMPGSDTDHTYSDT